MRFAGFTNFGNLASSAFCSSIACEMDLSMILVSPDNTILNSDFSIRKFKLSDIFKLTVAAVREVRKIVRRILLGVSENSFQSVFTVPVIK